MDETLPSLERYEMVRLSSGQTHICGQVLDQSELIGLLRKINNLGLELMDIRRLYENDVES